MKSAFRIIKIGLIVVACVIVCIIVINKISFDRELSKLESKYNQEPTDENLVELAVFLVDSSDYEKMGKYLPLASKVDNFIEISEENEWYCKSYASSEFAPYNTKDRVVVMGVLSYLYEEDYEGFHESFADIYDVMVEVNVVDDWFIVIQTRTDFSEEEYKHIIKALEDNKPKLPEINMDNRYEVVDYLYNLELQYEVYLKIDKDKADIIKEEKYEIIDKLKLLLNDENR